MVGTDPESGEEITAQNGRYGPYLKKGTDSRSLTSEDQLFTVTLDEALEIYRQPKQRGRRTAAATPPLRELGADTATSKPMVIKDGRFGPYVTDGETNASLRKGDSVEEITDERASELLAERRAEGPGAEEGPRPQARGQEAGATKAPRARRRRPRSSGVRTRTAGRARRSGPAAASPVPCVRPAAYCGAASSALTAAATRLPSARPAAAALAPLHDLPHLPRARAPAPSAASTRPRRRAPSRPARRR